MKLLTPEALWALLALPALWALWRRSQDPARAALQHRAIGTPASAGAAAFSWTSVPLTLWCVALAMAVMALCRPHATLAVPVHSGRVMLALDVSGSMAASDIGPSRLQAAKDTAKAFAQGLPKTIRVGIVAFGERAAPLLEPTEHKAEIIAAIERLHPMQGTSLASAIAVAVATLHPEAHIDPYALRFGFEAMWAGLRLGKELAPSQPQAGNPVSAIVLLTDGESTTEPHPLEAARLAAKLGVRVFAIGIGTRAGQPLRSQGFSLRVRLDEPTLRQVADITGGAYFGVEAADALSGIYPKLSARLGFEQRYLEVSGLFALSAALFAALAALLSVHRHKRIL